MTPETQQLKICTCHQSTGISDEDVRLVDSGLSWGTVENLYNPEKVHRDIFCATFRDMLYERPNRPAPPATVPQKTLGVVNYKRHNQGIRAKRRRKSYGYWVPKRARLKENRRAFDF
jgi:hypothetical protein